MLEIIVYSVLGLSLLANFFLVFTLRGAMRKEPINDDSIRELSGKEIETLRRKFVRIGVNGLTNEEIFSLFQTIRSVQLGIYVDSDPWLPANPYEDIDQDSVDKV